jgi:hypothetical protein
MIDTLPLTKRTLTRAFFDAKIALGERMYAAGIDDGRLGSQIAAVDERVCQAHSSQAAGEMLESERRRLLRRLAEAALEEDAPLPGADAEYARARTAQTVLQGYSVQNKKRAMCPGRSGYG